MNKFDRISWSSASYDGKNLNPFKAFKSSPSTLGGICDVVWECQAPDHEFWLHQTPLDPSQICPGWPVRGRTDKWIAAVLIIPKECVQLRTVGIQMGYTSQTNTWKIRILQVWPVYTNLRWSRKFEKNLNASLFSQW